MNSIRGASPDLHAHSNARPAHDAPGAQRRVYHVVAQQPDYAPRLGSAHWREGGHALGWAVACVPGGAACAMGFAGVTGVFGAAMATGSAVAVGIGCGTVLFAPVLVPFGVYLGLCSALTIASGAVLTSTTVLAVAACTTYKGAQASKHACLAFAEDAGF